METTFHGESPALDRGAGLVTLVDGATFSLSANTGDLRPGGTHGLYVLDRRLLTQWTLRLDGRELDGLAVHHTGPGAARFVARERLGPGRSNRLLVLRDRSIGRGLREVVQVRNHGAAARTLVVDLAVDVDFADLFAVKRGVREPHLGDVGTGEGVLCFDDDEGRLGVRVNSSTPSGSGTGLLVWSVTLAPGETWSTELELEVLADGEPLARVVEHGSVGGDWHVGLGVSITTEDERVADAWSCGVRDLDALVMSDDEHPGDRFVAAGAPWFMTLFGRDSLWVGWMSLLAGPDLLAGSLSTLARLQGHRLDHASEEQPGRILHEVRAGRGASPLLADSERYYGTRDATPLFVTMAGELARWHGLAAVQHLAGPIDAAMDWIGRFGDLDDDGLVEYQRSNATGLVNQSWKDSWDAICFANGRLAQLPIATCEVQGYVHRAHLARAALAAAAGDEPTAHRHQAEAAMVAHRLETAFWLDDDRGLAMALDGDKAQVDGLGSNPGHVLWATALSPERAEVVRRRLMAPESFTGFGLRTLGSDMRIYDPLSYHNGSVWPHDTAIAAAGMAAYGFDDDARRLIDGLLDASADEGGRLPELFSGLDRSEVDRPVPYPTSCSPQAWSAATSLLLVRLALGLEPDLLSGVVRLRPLWRGPGVLRVRGIPLGGTRVDVSVDAAGRAVVLGLPPGIEVVHEERVDPLPSEVGDVSSGPFAGTGRP